MIELGAVRGTVPCTTPLESHFSCMRSLLAGVVQGTVPSTTLYHPHHPLSYLHLAVYGRTMKLNSGLQGENPVCGSSA